MLCFGGSVALFKSGDPAVVGHVADDFVFGEEAEGLLGVGTLEPCADVLEAVLAVESGLGTGSVDLLAAVPGQELVDEPHHDAQAGGFAGRHESLGPQPGIGTDLGGPTGPAP